MAHKYLYKRDGDKEEILHVGDTGTLVGFRSDIGIAAALAEMKRASGQAALAKELSAPDFERAKEQSEEQKADYEASLPKVNFKHDG